MFLAGLMIVSSRVWRIRLHEDGPSKGGNRLQSGFTKGIATVDEELGAWNECGLDRGASHNARFRKATVQSPDADRDRNIVGLLAGCQHEVFGVALAKLKTSGRHGPGVGTRLIDGLLRTVDGQNMAIANARGEGAGHRARAAADFQHAHSRPERQGIHNRLQARGQRGRHVR